MRQYVTHLKYRARGKDSPNLHPIAVDVNTNNMFCKIGDEVRESWERGRRPRGRAGVGGEGVAAARTSLTMP